MFSKLEDILSDSAIILFLNGLDYPANDHEKVMDCMVIQKKALNHIIDEYKNWEDGSIVVFYDCGNKFESDLAKMIRTELRDYSDKVFLLGVKDGLVEHMMMYSHSFKITMNKEENIQSEYSCYFESKNKYKGDISIDKNNSGYCIIEDGIKRDPWSRDGDIVAIGRTEVIEHLMDNYRVKVKSYYMWSEKENKKIGDIHPGPEGKTSELTHHYHLFQSKHRDVGYVYFY